MTRFTSKAALAPLKDFQRTTAEHVFARLYGGEDPVRRFLIADEVGLGKTLVARGVIAKAVEHLQDTAEQVNIVYVCSNAQIARQNVRRLKIEEQSEFALAERITMLPAVAHRLADNAVNLVSFTPGTSFQLTDGAGTAPERALLRLLLTCVWGREHFRTVGSMRVFQGGVRTLDRFRATYADTRRRHAARLDDDLVAGFGEALRHHDGEASARGEAGLRARYAELTDTFTRRPAGGWSAAQRSRRARFIGELRNILARACLQSLNPDLIILDEFQRFKHLLVDPDSDRTSPAAELANELFTHGASDSGTGARVLLLSATPYKLHTNQHDDEDHHQDLVDTVRFLLDHDTHAVDRLRGNLRQLRRSLLQVGEDNGAAAKRILGEVESTLRRVMVRTERLASTEDRSGMLEDRPTPGVALSTGEVARYAGAARLARHLSAPDPLEYWKSAPFLLNFADGYQLRAHFDQAVDDHDPALGALSTATGLLDVEAVRRFDEVTIDHPRLKWLIEDTVGGGAWQLLWIPPSLPSLRLEGPFGDPALRGFTKRLVFSSWKIVPTAIATLTTYEAERRMVTAAGPAKYDNTPQARRSTTQLLNFSYSNERLTGMPVLGLLYPSVVLSRLGDLRGLSRNRGGEPLDQDEALQVVTRRVQRRLEEFVASQPAGVSGDERQDDPRRDDGGREDVRWYWAAPLLLDHADDPATTREFFGSLNRLRRTYVGKDTTGVDRFGDHLERAADVAGGDVEGFGRPPRDLATVLAKIAIAGPGVTAARALASATNRNPDELAVRFAACRAAWGLRSLFNTPEATELIHHLYPGDPYWQRTLDYSLAGDLQAVLDEYAHVLLSGRGHLDPDDDATVRDVAGAMHDAARLRTVPHTIDEITVDGETVRVEPARMRVNYALRLTNDRNESRSQERETDVRDAFNSPFRPFVLATTSAGQEGLDFHTYCHAVVHWNLPANPVDLEQRDGRVHRFQGHAVRRNVARRFATVGRTAHGNGWDAMFDAAHHDRPDEATDIIPYWVYVTEGGDAVHRYIPSLPLSRDRAHAAALQKAVAAYRLAFGQPRQEDLLAYLSHQLDEDRLRQLARELRIDLEPGPR